MRYMKLILKQKIFSLMDSYDIYDEYDQVVYTVSSRLSWGHKLDVYDPSGHCLATIKEEILTFMPRFTIYINHHYIFKFHKKICLFHKYIIVYKNRSIIRNFMNWNYTISDSYHEIATISKELFHFTDVYVIDVHNSQDALYALLVVLAIDAEKCSASNN